MIFQKDNVRKIGKSGFCGYIFVLSNIKTVSYDESYRLEIHLWMVEQVAPERGEEANSEQ
jgi:hypothetical protein